jgi:hypothetical protein
MIWLYLLDYCKAPLELWKLYIFLQIMKLTFGRYLNHHKIVIIDNWKPKSFKAQIQLSPRKYK